jgi:hypothetical protein
VNGIEKPAPPLLPFAPPEMRRFAWTRSTMSKSATSSLRCASPRPAADSASRRIVAKAGESPLIAAALTPFIMCSVRSPFTICRTIACEGS